MKELKLLVIITLIFLGVNLSGMIAMASADERGLGEKLVRQLWADVKAGNVETLKKNTAPGFQSIHEDGSRNRKEELQLIQKANIGKYTLTNLRVYFPMFDHRCVPHFVERPHIEECACRQG